MPSVESVLDEFVGVQTVDDPVCVLLDGCGEDDKFEVLAHFFEESLDVGS